MQLDLDPDPAMRDERVALGGALSDVLGTQDVIAKLQWDDFSLDAHQRIYRAIAKLAAEGQAAGIDSVWSALRAKGEMEAIGGVGYLASLTEGIPQNFHLAATIARVLDRSLARRSIKACQRAITRFMEGDAPSTHVLDELSKSLMAERPQDTLHVSAVMPRAIQRLIDGGGERIPTGIPELDEMLAGGLLTKRLVIIGAQPSFGKSALARQIERSALRHGFGVHSHSIEVPDEDWMLYHAASGAQVPAWRLQNRKDMRAVDIDRMKGAAAEICEMNHMIDDIGGVHINTLLAKSRLTAMRQGVKLFTVDYLQMLHGDERNPRILMGQIARSLKEFAKNHDVCVVALSQVARQGDINARPTVQHLKESGDIEAAADVIILPYRPKDPATGHYTGEDQLIVGKQRDGAIGAIDMYFNSETLQYGARRESTFANY